MNKYICIISIITLLSYSCTNNPNIDRINNIQESSFIDEHNAKNSLDWHGNYEGKLYCNDCPETQTSITLKIDNTFEINNLHKNKNNKYKGIIQWSDDGNNITLEDNKYKVQYKVAEHRLIPLIITGPTNTRTIQDMYILNKKQ